jgi:Thioredoxin-like domain
MKTRVLVLLFILELIKGDCELPNFSVGHFNITSERQLKEIIKKESVFLIGISASSCSECCKTETVYQSLTENMKQYRPIVPLLRIDLDSASFIRPYIPDHDKLPEIYGVRKGKFFKYNDVLDVMKLIRFADKLISTVTYLTTYEDIDKFLEPPLGGFNSLKVIAFLYDSDLKGDFEKAVSPMANWFSSDIKGVLDKSLIKMVKNNRPDIKYLNSVVLLRGNQTKILDLDLPQDIFRWIALNSVALVDEITGYNFHIYQATGLPMLILFLDSKNIYNSDYLEIYQRVARQFEGVVNFVWIDGTKPEYSRKKNNLGLFTEILPALAFNSQSKGNYAYPEGSEITEKAISVFVQDHLDKKPSKYKDEYIYNGINLEDCEGIYFNVFDERVINEYNDAVFFIYSSTNSKASEKLAPIYNKVCKRFRELGYPNLRTFAIDASGSLAHKTVKLDRVPLIFMAPADRKSNPYIRYTGQLTPLAIMKFIESNADTKIKLPELPHLTTEEVEEYKKLKQKSEENLKEKSNTDL